MGSIDDLLGEFETAHSRFLASRFHSLTVPELLAALEQYGFLMGQLGALRYELTSPFGCRPGAAFLSAGRNVVQHEFD
jgi:hypothetical protein